MRFLSLDYGLHSKSFEGLENSSGVAPLSSYRWVHLSVLCQNLVLNHTVHPDGWHEESPVLASYGIRA